MEIVRIFRYGHVKVEPEWPHESKVYINRLYYVHGGRGYCHHNGIEYEFLPGRLYFIPGSTDLRLYTDSDNTILHTYMDFDIMPPVITKEILSADISDDDFLRFSVEIFEAGGKYMQQKELTDSFNSCPEQMKKLFESASSFIVSHILMQNKLSVIEDKTILKALDIIHKNFNQSLTVEYIARQCFMSKDYFIRKFSKTVGFTPYAYIKRLRIMTARHLREQGISLSEIAVKTGYSDASSVSHALKERI
ncbi:MAG: helix-turn-helix domain-containing protein [Clostridia bacterium]|nr:helix-turn-helix domain-containing protein [Clostridia bacterium]